MPDITIQINTPLLTAGQSFKTRYRILPSGAWSSYVTRTNASFTLTGLAAGDYELEVILVKGSTECPATIRKFTVTQPFTCTTFTAEIVQAGSQYNLEISYAFPPGYVQPPCGWTIQAIGTSTNKTINYTTLPASPIKIPAANEGMLVRVIANLCDGKTQICYEGDVVPIVSPCIGISSVTATGKFLGVNTATNQRRFSLTFHFTQPVMPHKRFVIGINQVNTYPNGTVQILSYNPYVHSSGSNSITFTFYGIQPVKDDCNYEFEWFIMDECFGAFFNTPGTPLLIYAC